MGYRKAIDVLPEELLSEIQKYVDGQTLYIPRKSEEHTSWGERSGIRKRLENRDKRIYEEHLGGAAVSELAAGYCLSEKSIQRILRKAGPPRRMREDGGHTIE